MKTLSKMNVITPQMAEKASSMIKMRNVIVYQYGKIDYGLLFQGLSQPVSDFPEFQNQVLHWIEQQEESAKF